MRSRFRFFDTISQLYYVFIISAIAGILLKPQDVNIFFSTIFGMILNNSDILFGSDYKREN